MSEGVLVFSWTPQAVITTGDSATTSSALTHHHGQWRFSGCCWSSNASPYSFIGSTTAEQLMDLGHDVFALDSLIRGRADNIPSRATFVQGDCGDAELIRSLGAFDACVHFAARIEPADSMVTPEQSFPDNVARTFSLCEALIETGTSKMVFSSSCAVYGNQVEMPIDENRATKDLDAGHGPHQ